MTSTEPITDYSMLSRRAVRRLVQRAFVLAGRDRVVRQHIREAAITTLWVIEDRDVKWTLAIDHGRLEFERRAAKQPDATFRWSSGDAFFQQVQAGALDPEETTFPAPPVPKRTWEAVFRAFARALTEVLNNPVDGNGDPLV